MFATLFSNLSWATIIGLEISNWFTRKPDNSINGASHWRESGEAKQGWQKGVELKQRERRKKRNYDGLQFKDYIEWNGIVNIVILRHKGGSNRADQATSGGQGNNRGWPLRQPSVAFSLLLLAPPPPRRPIRHRRCEYVVVDCSHHRCTGTAISASLAPLVPHARHSPFSPAPSYQPLYPPPRLSSTAHHLLWFLFLYSTIIRRHFAVLLSLREAKCLVFVFVPHRHGLWTSMARNLNNARERVFELRLCSLQIRFNLFRYEIISARRRKNESSHPVPMKCFRHFDLVWLFCWVYAAPEQGTTSVSFVWTRRFQSNVI